MDKTVNDDEYAVPVGKTPNELVYHLSKIYAAKTSQGLISCREQVLHEYLLLKRCKLCYLDQLFSA